MISHILHKYVLGNQTILALLRLGEELTSVLGVIFFLLLFTFASCSDDDLAGGGQPYQDGETEVTLNIKAQAPDEPMGATRAPVYEGGNSDEMMKTWFVVIVNSNNNIERIVTSQNSTTYKQEDYGLTRLQNGSYTAYSFANIPISEVGLSQTSVGTQLPEGFDEKTMTVNGNQQSIAGFPYGIPMSNKETFTIDATTHRVDLSVVRMVVKFRLQFHNTTKDSVYVTNFSINDITNNADDNLKLLPGPLVEGDTTGRRQINLNNIGIDDQTKKSTFNYAVDPNSQLLVPGQSRQFEFYVNESQARSNINHFVIGITTQHKTKDLSTRRDTTYTRYRYAFINWNSIARNELYVLPIDLERYHIEFYVRAFTAIGVLPMWDNEPEIATIDFGLYGHYDIIPRIRDMVTGVYYYQQNRTNEQGITVTNLDTEHETQDMTIDSMKLVTDSKGVGIRWDYDGWGPNEDGSGEPKRYPTVGWNHTAMTPRIECITGNYTGWAIYTVNASFSTADGEKHDITRRFRINNTYVDLSQLAKQHKW